ncbi:hypothetical protein MSG28_004502 [Choristoneura fumiferana]|uniref:Uncharacterized protein n=1 Tax=Choristoneura fumiferana TaxID=7141 RepID=A0ACC0K6G6_CHOFU|nr:hypothetical protein MSG28_004502 [Choristoneura fumiferana]
MGDGECCFVFKPHKGCLVLGLVTFLCSTFLTVTSCYYIIVEEEGTRISPVLHGPPGSNRTHHILGLDLKKPVIHIILVIILIMGVLWMTASLMLVYGIRKNKATCVMFYFFVGFIVTLLLVLSAILELVQKMWPLSLVTFMFSMMYAYCLVAVYSFYEQLRRSGTLSDTDQLILDEDFDTDIENVD